MDTEENQESTFNYIIRTINLPCYAKRTAMKKNHFRSARLQKLPSLKEISNEMKNSPDAFQIYRQVLPSQFVDAIFYPYVLCEYGDEGELILDLMPSALDDKLRNVLQEYFTELDKLAMEHIED